MKQRVLYILNIFLRFTLVFAAMKPIFMLYNNQQSEIGLKDFVDVIVHGLPLDFSTAGYLCAFPLLVMLIGSWVRLPFEKRVLKIYYIVLALLLSIILCVDCVLYSFWQFKLDATIFNYLDSPQQALASVPVWFVLIGVLVILFLAAVIYIILNRPKWEQITSKRHAAITSVFLILTGGILFLFIRGGVGKSTMNVGAVYYSENQFLNHSAVNPAFNLIYSTLKAKKYDEEYRFFDENKREELYAQLHYEKTDSLTQEVLQSKRPNILLILMEGFSGAFIERLGGEKGVTPQFERLSKEGIFFTECYANSFRTDRGTVSALSGYPAFPKISVMKIPEKSRNLPSLAKSLGEVGYRTNFLYGGDINFTNMKSYLLSTGYKKVIGDTHFPLSIRKTHAWGVTDRIVFDTLYNQVLAYPKNQPWFTTFLTLASHEPWEVPYNRIKNNIRTNSMAYLDDCLGHFVDRLKKTPLWENLLIVCVADHGIGYPLGITEADKQRYRIPLLWIGGTLKSSQEINALCNQSDLPVTLLKQLGLPTNDFVFSRDVLSPAYDYPFAFHTFDNGFAFIDSTGYTVQDFNSGKILTDFPQPSKRRLDLGHAILQTTIDDFSKR